MTSVVANFRFFFPLTFSFGIATAKYLIQLSEMTNIHNVHMCFADTT